MSKDPKDAPDPQRPVSAAEGRGAHARRWLALALLLFALASVWQFREIFRDGFGSVVPIDSLFVNQKNPWRDSTRADVVFHTFTVSRGARALLEHPFSFLEAPQCFPFAHSATFGIPMGAMAVLGIPFVLAQDNPIVTYNAAILLTLFFACLAMFLLVREWTASPPAAIVAGLFYGLSPLRLREINFTSELDDAWMVFALFFATRWLANGGWRPVLGIAVAFVLQAIESVYSLLEASVLLPPILAWMALRFGLRRITAAQVAFLGAVAVAVVAWFFVPYIESRELGLITDRTGQQLFASPVQLLPGRYYFLGWVVSGLGLVGLFYGKRGIAREMPGDPRAAIAVAMLGVAWVAAGPTAAEATGLPIPDAYGTLAGVLPGLDNIRGVSRLVIGMYFCAVLLGGIGLASVFRTLALRHPRWERGVALSSILLAGIVAAEPGWLGLEERVRWTAQPIEIDLETIEFFEELEARGNTGPLLELPWDTKLAVLYQSPKRVLQTHYHRRRTSACAGSFYPPERERVGKLALDLPRSRALEELSGMGFTTVVVHHSGHFLADPDLVRRRYARQMSDAGYRLRPILQTEARSAWVIEAVGVKPRR